MTIKEVNKILKEANDLLLPLIENGAYSIDFHENNINIQSYPNMLLEEALLQKDIHVIEDFHGHGFWKNFFIREYGICIEYIYSMKLKNGGKWMTKNKKGG